MGAENEIMRPGTYFMMKSYLIQLLTLVVREQMDQYRHTIVALLNL